jgi:hypothetical protein
MNTRNFAEILAQFDAGPSMTLTLTNHWHKKCFLSAWGIGLPICLTRSGVVMKSISFRISALIAVVTIVGSLFGTAVAQQRNERQVRDIIRNLNSQVDSFQYTIEDDMQRSSANSRDISDVSQSLDNLQDKLKAFEDNLNARRENRDDVNEVVTAAQDIESYFRRERPSQRIQQDWSAIRNNIDRLAGSYGVTPNWSGRVSAVQSSQGSRYPSRSTSLPSNDSDLTGTYRLDTSRSENTDQILTESNVGGAQRQDLQKKLEAPQQIAIRVNGDQITLASSNASPVSFTADGREKTDTDANGRTIRLRATIKGDELTIASLGGDSDYTIIFTPMDGGRSLKVTRRITTDYLRQTVFADSVYQKTNDVALLGIDQTVDDSATGAWSSSDDQNGGPVVAPGRTGDFVVPNGTIITAQLENTIDTKVSQNNDKFRMTVQSPMEYRGAVIVGHVTGVGRSGRVSGRSNVTFNFDTITLRDGKTYDFAGFLQSIRDQNGKTVRVDTEGVATSGSQTKETAKRGGIGAGVGAIIGAIAGGGTGAAVGAIIGGGVGAGSVIVQGRDDVQLYKGSTMTIQASSPIRGDQPVDN